mmetsp:Transcript_2364/g.3296  ORF Transcript_2364/g.3296 Transcript_2364/m.3296 type:complete len:537 (+) Transcript_2364:100-1710(+)
MEAQDSELLVPVLSADAEIREVMELSKRQRIFGFAFLLLFYSFGNGFQSIPVFNFLAQVLLLWLLDRAAKRSDFVLIWACASLGTFVAYMKLVGTDMESILILGAIVFVGSMVFGLITVLSLKLLPRKYPAFEVCREFIYPITFTSFYCLTSIFASSWMNPAYGFMDFPSLYNLVTLFGLDGVNFLTAWGASLAALHMRREHQQIQERRNIRTTELFFGLLFLVLIYGGSYNLNSNGRFYQADIVDWDQDTFNAVCLVGYESDSSISERLKTTEKVATGKFFLDAELNEASADIVLWSETAVLVNSSIEEKKYLDGMQDIAVRHGTIVGVTYLLKIGENLFSNVFTLILNDGSIAFRYEKVNPVFMVESNVRPGRDLAPIVETRLGKIGGAICFDFDFPAFIRRASDSATLMLQPGWDWGPIGTLHAKMDATRALENGFTLFRCSSGGVSGVYSPYFETIYEKVMGTLDGEGTSAYTTQIPQTKRVRTLYSYLGNFIGHLSTVFVILMLLLCVIPPSFLPEKLLELLNQEQLRSTV